MFVAEGARARLVAERRDQFREQYVQPLLVEADKLGISPAELSAMIQKGAAT
jgi:hypothetical protein